MMENNPVNVQFHYLVKDFRFESRQGCKNYLHLLFRKEGKKLEQLNYIFCSDDYLLEMNKKHLRHNFYTDILTFGLSDPGQPIVGEIYISIDRVRENAQSLGEPFKRELHRVIFHGALHLCGYADKSVAQAQEMRRLEDKHLKAYFK